MLPVLKRYVGAVDESQDAILQQMLTTAALEIQEHADISVLPCEMELRVENNDSELVRLYQTPKEVTSVTTADGQSRYRKNAWICHRPSPWRCSMR